MRLSFLQFAETVFGKKGVKVFDRYRLFAKIKN